MPISVADMHVVVLMLILTGIPAVIPDLASVANSLALQDMFYQRFLDHYQFNETASGGGDTDAIRHKTFFVDPNDPLHAYPDAQDEFIHDLFQTITVYEINNSERIRKCVKVASALGIVSLAFIGLGVVAFVSPTVVAIGRSSQDSTGSNELLQLTSTIFESIQKAHAIYKKSWSSHSFVLYLLPFCYSVPFVWLYSSIG